MQTQKTKDVNFIQDKPLDAEQTDEWTCCQQCGKQTEGERRCEECSPDHNKEEE